MIAVMLAAFISIFVAEFGDKTQLVSLSMACRYPPLQVLAGAMVALFLVMALAVGAGGFMAAYIPQPVIILVSGIFFVIMGLFTLLSKEQSKELCSKGKAGFYQTLGAVFLAEMGDKTQIAAMLLTASLGRPAAVLAGAMLAMFVNHALAIFLGARFFSRINPRYLKTGTSMLFITIGLLIIFLR